MPKLIIRCNEKEWFVELKDGPNVVGRSSKCTIPVNDSSLSREHFEIVNLGGECTLFDHQSRNGTMVNGKRLNEHPLRVGDEIRAGHSFLWFESKPAPELPTEAPKQGTQRTTADFSIWAKRGYRRGWAFIVLALVSGVALAAFVLNNRLGVGRTEDQDRENLIERNPSFELPAEGAVPYWALKGAQETVLGIERAQAWEGRQSLVIDKGNSASDLLAECVSSEILPVTPGTSYEMSAWARAQAFSGSAALSVTWMSRGFSLATERSDPEPLASEWKPLRATFVAPPTASSMEVGLAALGRAGRIFYDAVKLTGRGSAGGRSQTPEPFTIHSTRQGVLTMTVKNTVVATHAGVRLFTGKDGVSPQAFSAGGAWESGEGKVSYQGRLTHPVHLRDVEYRLEVRVNQEETTVAYAFPAEALRQIDRVDVMVTLPGVDRLAGVSGSGTVVDHVNYTIGERNIKIGFPEPVSVSVEQFQGGVRVLQHYPVTAPERGLILGYKIREGDVSPGSGIHPIQEAVRKAQQEKNYGEALSLLRSLKDRGTTGEEALDVARRIREIEEIEATEWSQVRMRVFEASLTRRREACTAAVQALEAYQSHFSGEAFAIKAETLMADLTRLFPLTRDMDRSHHLYEEAQRHAAAGKKQLARAMLEALLNHYPESTVIERARELLKTLENELHR